MPQSIQQQKPATKNQITNTKPTVGFSANYLQGWIANSFNAGHIRTIFWAPIMAGTKHVEQRLQCRIKLLTPRVPSYQGLKITFRTYFVPNSRVWDNAEAFTGQAGGSTTTKVTEIPNIGGKKLGMSELEPGAEQNMYIMVTDTDLWRDSWISSYFPRYESMMAARPGQQNEYIMPKYSVLPLRGFKAIYNDYERNKEYDEKLKEFKGDTVTAEEYADLFDITARTQLSKHIIRGKRQNSYYTDYRTELLGFDLDEPTGENADLISKTEWEKMVAEGRSQAENAQLNDWDIIAKIRGSKRLTQGKVQLLGTKTVGLNYQAITQTTYNTNEDIREEFQVMGQQGAYSYTEIDIPLYQMTEFVEEGYIHVIAQVSADTVFETGFERTSLNVGALDVYRPDLKDLKHDVLYKIEKAGTGIYNEKDLKKITGFKRKFSEYFKNPNVITGDLTTTRWYNTKFIQGSNYAKITKELSRIEMQNAYSFFELSDERDPQISSESGSNVLKAIWKDYTDLALNKNQAIENEVQLLTGTGTGNYTFVRVLGQNQIILMGVVSTVADMPIDEEIKRNFTKWGEK